MPVPEKRERLLIPAVLLLQALLVRLPLQPVLLTVTTLSFDASNTTDANQVLTRSGAGAITITNAFTLVHGTISMTGAGTL